MEEVLHEDFRLKLKMNKVLFDSKSDHQRLVLFENGSFGRVLTLDDVVQTTERDEFIYHEMLSHLPILAHGSVNSVLIIGGGDGGMAEEVLKHKSVDRLVQVEIDRSVVEFSKTYLGDICRGAYDDPRLALVIADGIEFVTTTEERFDLIIVDSTDPVGPGEVLFTEPFYGGCKRVLKKDGVVVTQNGVPFLQGGELADSLSYLAPLFQDVTCYLATIPTYAGGPMAFGWASDAAKHRETSLEILSSRYEASGISTDYYNPEVHKAAFALPNYLKRLLPEAA
ncbi:MAG: polyamine aminopropyltransferase [Kiloniellales bacterium]|nr:polyamine aminopropyltransferase [Kiloniellales bacterium]